MTNHPNRKPESITLRNEYHNTSYTLRAKLHRDLSRSQVLRARKALCGIAGCQCGGNLGERGSQMPYEIVAAGYDADGHIRIYITKYQR